MQSAVVLCIAPVSAFFTIARLRRGLSTPQQALVSYACLRAPALLPASAQDMPLARYFRSTSCSIQLLKQLGASIFLL